jgi:RimJ/RimL family protein N-acetyltransferase
MMLREVDIHDEADIRFLYHLLAVRPQLANISHRELPSWEEHVAFVIGQPYHAWYIVLSDGTRAGACYLSKRDEIGIHLLELFQGKGLAREAVRNLMKRHERVRYLANIAPSNERSLALFGELGFRACQVTMERVCASP